MPSAATRSPGRTSITSPGASAAASTSRASPSSRRRAVAGASDTSPRTASDSRERARASSSLPIITNATIAAPAVEVMLVDQKAKVVHDPERSPLPILIAAVEGAGYAASAAP